MLDLMARPHTFRGRMCEPSNAPPLKCLDVVRVPLRRRHHRGGRRQAGFPCNVGEPRGRARGWRARAAYGAEAAKVLDAWTSSPSSPQAQRRARLSELLHAFMQAFMQAFRPRDMLPQRDCRVNPTLQWSSTTHAKMSSMVDRPRTFSRATSSTLLVMPVNECVRRESDGCEGEISGWGQPSRCCADFRAASGEKIN